MKFPALRLLVLSLMAVIGATPLLAAEGGVGASGPAARSQEKAAVVEIEATPRWVVVREIPEATSARIAQAEAGTAWLLVDLQTFERSDGRDQSQRYALKVTGRSGLESAGQIDTTFDPAFEQVALQFVRIIRDGKTLDLTRQVRFSVVEREDDLDDGIVSGTLKAIANLPDVRVGDIVDYAFTIRTRTTLWPGHAFAHLSQRYSIPVAMGAIRYLWPIGLSPAAKAINSDVRFTTRETADGTEWEWIARDPIPVKAEDNVPPSALQWGRIDISTMKSWEEVARWASAVYEGDNTLPPEFTARLDAIAGKWPQPEDRLTEAARLVQDSIRYVGEELGEGSFVPRRPALVLARGYGDCKDKALLLAVALRHLGIESSPALVSTDYGTRLPDFLPSPVQFDHVVVRAIVAGRVLWIDATGTHRGGRGLEIVPADFGYALPVRSGQSELELMEGFAAHAGKAVVLEQFSVDEVASAPLSLHVETRYSGARADRMRAGWESGTPKSISDQNLDFYRKRFAGIVESKPLELKDERDANVLTMVENYALPRDAFVKANILGKLTTRAYMLQDVLPGRQSSPRVQPLALPRNIVMEQTIELRVKNRVLDALDDFDRKAGEMAFQRRTTRMPDGVKMDYRLETGSTDSASGSAVEAIFALSDTIKDETGTEFYLDKSPKSERAAIAQPDGIAGISTELGRIQALVRKNDQLSQIAALSLIAAASAKLVHPSPAAGLLDGIKGAVLSDLKRPEAALAAFRSATAQFDGNPDVYRLWIAYELDLGTADSVAKAFTRTQIVQPGIVTGLDERWVSVALRKLQTLDAARREPVRQELCVALSRAKWQQSPRSAFGDAMLGCAIAAYSQRGDIAAARTSMADDPPGNALVALALDRRHQVLWPEIGRKAGPGFRNALEADLKKAVAATAAGNSYKTLTRQMQALRALGRAEEALKLGKPMATDMARVEAEGTDAFWQVNEYAMNLRVLGRFDAAVAAFDAVLALGPEKYPELASLEINRAEAQFAAGRFADVVTGLAALEDKRSAQLSIFGKMFLWSTKACALRALGRLDEAAAVETKLVAKPDDNWSAATGAASCRGDVEATGDMLIARLRDPDSRAAALGLFLDFGTPDVLSPRELAMRGVLRNARKLPRVQAEFVKFGRTIPYAGSPAGWSEF